MKPKYGCSPEQIGHYNCCQIKTPLEIKGDLSSSAWQQAPKSPRFVDMVTGIPGFFDTRMAALWDKKYLYIGDSSPPKETDILCQTFASGTR